MSQCCNSLLKYQQYSEGEKKTQLMSAQFWIILEEVIGNSDLGFFFFSRCNVVSLWKYLQIKTSKTWSVTKDFNTLIVLIHYWKKLWAQRLGQMMVKKDWMANLSESQSRSVHMTASFVPADDYMWMIKLSVAERAFSDPVWLNEISCPPLVKWGQHSRVPTQGGVSKNMSGSLQKYCGPTSPGEVLLIRNVSVWSENLR